MLLGLTTYNNSQFLNPCKKDFLHGRQGSVTAVFWRFRVPETRSLPYQISYAIKFERSFSMMYLQDD